MLELALIIALFVCVFLPDNKLVKKSLIEVGTEEDIKIVAKNLRKMYGVLALLFACHAGYEIASVISTDLAIVMLLILVVVAIVFFALAISGVKKNNDILKKYDIKTFGK